MRRSRAILAALAVFAAAPAWAADAVGVHAREAQDFLNHVSAARNALAARDAAAATRELDAASAALTTLDALPVSARRFSDVPAGQVTYSGGRSVQGSDLIPLQGAAAPPPLARGEAADAQATYWQVDVAGANTARLLASAKEAAQRGEFAGAQGRMDQLLRDTVHLGAQAALPADKARDNVALARKLLQAGDSEASRAALAHADNALSLMEVESGHSGHRGAIHLMRDDIARLQDSLRRGGANAGGADAVMQGWQNNLNGWSAAETQHLSSRTQ